MASCYFGRDSPWLQVAVLRALRAGGELMMEEDLWKGVLEHDWQRLKATDNAQNNIYKDIKPTKSYNLKILWGSVQ